MEALVGICESVRDASELVEMVGGSHDDDACECYEVEVAAMLLLLLYRRDTHLEQDLGGLRENIHFPFSLFLFYCSFVLYTFVEKKPKLPNKHL